MTESNNKLTDAEIGERLRLAREAANLTQAAAADAIGAVRTTIVALEQGKRRVRIDELQKLTKLYNTSANAILRREAIHVDLVPRFRKLAPHTDAAVDAAARLLSDLVRAEVELENALGVMRQTNYPPERPILPGMSIFRPNKILKSYATGWGLGQVLLLISSPSLAFNWASASISGLSMLESPGYLLLMMPLAGVCCSIRIILRPV